MTEIYQITPHIVGQEIKLADNRSVFVGTNGDRDDLTYIRFENGEDVTRVKLSPEAVKALAMLLPKDVGEFEVVAEVSYPNIVYEGTVVWMPVEENKE